MAFWCFSVIFNCCKEVGGVDFVAAEIPVILNTQDIVSIMHEYGFEVAVFALFATLNVDSDRGILVINELEIADAIVAKVSLAYLTWAGVVQGRGVPVVVNPGTRGRKKGKPMSSQRKS